MNQEDKHNSAKLLVNFIHSYCQIMERQLELTGEIISETTSNMLNDIEQISRKTATEKHSADEVLEQTYLNPDDEVLTLVNRAQDEVDALLDAFSGHSDESVPPPGHPHVESNAEKERDSGQLAKFAGRFSKHMEALATMDERVGGILLEIVGVLSRDDVISQRLTHVTDVLRAATISLSYLLVDFDGRFSTSNALKLQEELLQYTWNRYSMEEERQIFKRHFHPPMKKNAS